MTVTTAMTIEAQTPNPWLPFSERGPKLQPSGGGLVHTYETDERVLAEADWVYLQVTASLYQIHPIGWDALDVYGAFDGRNMARWTWEGPTSILPGETPNCTSLVEIAYSLTATAGSTWTEYQPGEYKLCAVKARITVTRPSTAYSFRITNFALRATRRAPPQRDVIGERFYQRG